MLSNTSSSQTEGHDLKPIRLRERREKNIKLKVLKGFSLRAGRCWNGIKQAVYEVLTKFFIYLKASYMPLCMEYDIAQMSATASHGGTDPSGPIFNDSAA